MIVYVVDWVSPEVAPVAVIDFAPPVVSATTNVALAVTQDPAPVVLDPPGVVPVVQVLLPVNEADVNAVVAKVSDSPEPKPDAVMVDPVSDSVGKP